MNSSEYKKYHESFMANNHGSGAVHTFICILYPLLLVLLSIFVSNLSTRRKNVIEFLIIIVPLIFGLTAFARYIYEITFILFTINVLILIAQCHKSKLFIVLNGKNVHREPKLFCISFLRGLTYLITVFCILAVDFRIFPRYLAKTEVFGFSMMDAGVGIFVVMSGLVHKHVNNISSLFRNNFNLLYIMSTIGIFRYFMVKQLNYQQHISEYGVHWNFYFTLAITKTLASFVLFCAKSKNTLAMSIFVAFIHQCVLMNGVQTWVTGNGLRDHFMDANREGISSCLGYVSLYLFGVYLKTKLQDTNIVRKKLLYVLLSICISTWVMVHIANWAVPVSRVLCNISYCFYIEALVVTVILILYLYEIFLYEKDVILPNIFNIINNNGLAYFLIANVVTGLINVTFRTLFINVYFSLLILHLYMLAMLFIVNALNARGIRLL